MYDCTKNHADQCIALSMPLLLVLFVFYHCKYAGSGKPVDNVSLSVPPAYLQKKATRKDRQYDCCGIKLQMDLYLLIFADERVGSGLEGNRLRLVGLDGLLPDLGACSVKDADRLRCADTDLHAGG